MGWLFSPFPLILIFTTFPAVIIGILVWQKRRAVARLPLALLMFAIAEWSLSAGLEAAAVDIPVKVFFGKIGYLGITTSPVLLLLFSVTFLRWDRWLTRRRLCLLFIIPAISILMAATNDLHFILWSSYTPSPLQGSNLLVYGHGPWFWVSVAYSYSALMVGVGLLLWAVFRWRDIYRRQAVVLVIGSLMPFAASISYVFELLPYPGLDLTPIGFALSGLAIFLGLFRYHFLDMVPVARDLLIEKMEIGMLILDDQKRVVEANPAARQILDLDGEIPGRVVSTLLNSSPELSAAVESGADFTLETSLSLQPVRWVEARFSALSEVAGRNGGYLLSLSDRTTYKNTEEAVLETALAISAALDYDQLLRRILDRIEHVISFDSASVTVVEGNMLRIVAARGFENNESIIGIRFSLDSTPNQHIVKTRKPFCISNVSESFPTFLQPPHDIILSWLCIPLFAQEEIIGTLNLDSHSAGHFSAQDQRMAEIFAAQVSVAMVNARLYREVSRRATEQSILNEIMQSITSRLELDALLAAIDEQISRLIHLPILMIALHHKDIEMWEAIYVRDVLDILIHSHASVKDGLTGYIIQHGEPLLLSTPPDIAAFLERSHQQNLGVMPVSFMGVPLLSGKQALGAMISEVYDASKPFTTQEFALFQQVGQQVAVALQNALLFQQLEQLATEDPLTGMYNRRRFFALANIEFERAVRYKKPLAVLMIDLDHFKRINDTYGHTGGDDVLRGVADLCRSSLRAVDILGRYGGEEFVIVLPETPPEQACEAAERLRLAFEAHHFPMDDGQAQITASFGVAGLNENDLRFDALLTRADEALYTAKQNGRNRVEFR